jgi:hypothetical protein
LRGGFQRRRRSGFPVDDRKYLQGILLKRWLRGV